MNCFFSVWISTLNLASISIQIFVAKMSDIESETDSIGAPKAGVKLKIIGFEEAAKKAGYFPWNDDTHYVLAKYAKKHQAYLVTDTKMEIKWTCVKRDLGGHALFEHLGNVGWKSLQTQFNRAKTEVLDRCGISKEGANLSGKGKRTEYEEFMIAIEKLLQSKKRKRDADKTKEHEQDVLLNGITGGHLEKQGQLNSAAKSTATKVTAKSMDSDLSQSSEKETETSSHQFSVKSLLGGMREDIQKLFGSGGGSAQPRLDDEETQMRKELLREQIDDARYSKMIKLKQLEKM